MQWLANYSCCWSCCCRYHEWPTHEFFVFFFAGQEKINNEIFENQLNQTENKQKRKINSLQKQSVCVRCLSHQPFEPLMNLFLTRPRTYATHSKSGQFLGKTAATGRYYLLFYFSIQSSIYILHRNWKMTNNFPPNWQSHKMYIRICWLLVSINRIGKYATTTKLNFISSRQSYSYTSSISTYKTLCGAVLWRHRKFLRRGNFCDAEPNAAHQHESKI